MQTKYASLRNHELRREIELALQNNDEARFRELLKEVLNRKWAV